MLKYISHKSIVLFEKNKIDETYRGRGWSCRVSWRKDCLVLFLVEVSAEGISQREEREETQVWRDSQSGPGQSVLFSFHLPHLPRHLRPSDLHQAAVFVSAGTLGVRPVFLLSEEDQLYPEVIIEDMTYHSILSIMIKISKNKLTCSFYERARLLSW